ncbi:Protein AF-10 [Armadillidium nasatum]|uniref:Protein AF-10 n=1 Tax=Armadillidium nasatum TaxID=96803 RepID=A0A5N5SQ86_9CRUS|nr:Protein AF-10 [Armadillidium nasatum]
MKPKQEDPKEMVGGCCVCSDENGWAENPLVYCDGQGCNVAVHQACYGIVTVPTGAWFCRKCESQERAARVNNLQRCELCPSKDGALKRTDSGGWAHVVCALYIPEVRFGNVTTMEPIMLQLIPQERFNKSCYLCEEAQRGSKATIGACMQCNRAGCKNHFHVTCAQAMGLLCEEAGNYLDNVKYCGYCQYHYNKLLPNFQRRGSHVKTIPPYRPVPHDTVSSDEDKASGSSASDSKDLKIKKRSSSNKTSPIHDASKHITREVKVNLGGDLPLVSSKPSLSSGSESTSKLSDSSGNMDFSVNVMQSNTVNVKNESKFGSDKHQLSNSSSVPNVTTITTTTTSVTTSSKHSTNSVVTSLSDSKPTSSTFPSSNSLSHTSIIAGTSLSLTSTSSTILPTTSTAEASATISESGIGTTPVLSITLPSSVVSSSIPTPTNSNSAIVSSNVNLSSKLKITNSSTSSSGGHSSLITSGISQSTPSISVSLAGSSTAGDKEKQQQHQRKVRRNGSNSNSRSPATVGTSEDGIDDMKEAGALVICEERNLSAEPDKLSYGKLQLQPQQMNEDSNPSKYAGGVGSQFSTHVSGHSLKVESQTTSTDTVIGEPLKRGRSSSQDKGRRAKRGASNTLPSTTSKRGRIPMSSRGRENNPDSGASSPESLTSSDMVPAKRIAQKMTDTLHAELEAHSIYRDEEKINVGLIGPALPGKRETSTPGAVLNSTQPPPLPQSLEQLLERQWEQGSQFLMEQAQHFDIASLLSCLHQLRQENVRLEETVNNLIARRDHLLAVNARLSVPLSSSQATTQPSSSSSTAAAAAASSTSLACSTGLSLATSASTASLIPITPAVPPSVATSLIGGQLQISSHVGSVSSSTILASTRGPISQQQQRHPSGGSSHSGLGNPPSRVSGERGASPHDRRNHHQGQPLENGLPESEYRYRSPGSDHHSRQQSPMLPPGAQPSPTSLR